MKHPSTPRKPFRAQTVVSFPYLAFMIVFIAVPLLIVAYYAFTDTSGRVSFDNLSRVVDYFPIFSQSIIFGAIATAICLVVGYPVAYLMSRLSFARQKMMLMLIMLPMWMNFLLRTYAWMTILENNGIINNILAAFKIAPLHMMNTPGAVILGMVYNYLPFMILPLYSIMTKIDDRLIEAAQDLGAGTLKVFGMVVIPLSMPGVTSGITMVFVPAISTFVISNLLSGGKIFLVGDLIEQQFLGATYDPHIGASISLVLMVFILLIMAVLDQFDDDDQLEGVLL